MATPTIIHRIMENIIEMKNVKDFIDFIRILYTHDDTDISFEIPDDMLISLKDLDMNTRKDVKDMLHTIGTDLSPDKVALFIPIHQE